MDRRELGNCELRIPLLCLFFLSAAKYILLRPVLSICFFVFRCHGGRWVVLCGARYRNENDLCFD